MEKKKKKFKLVDAILATICITLVAESVMPTAAIGNSQYFWWIFLIIAFVLPYGLICSELGTTFPSEGGMYDWVKMAFGKKWAGRVAWNYWINFPLWIASLAVAVTDVIAGVFEVELSLWALLAFQLGYTLLVTLLSTNRIGENKWLVNCGAFFKILFMLGLGVLGIYVYIKTGESANPVQSVADLFPSLDLVGIGFISIIIFNVLGLEVVATFVDDMENPKKEIPKALIIGGALMAIFYILPATGINIAMPVEDAEAAGLTESFAILLTSLGVSDNIIRIIVIAVGLMFIYTMIVNIASWSFGVHSVAKYSADDGGLPAVFKKANKEGVATGSVWVCGIVAIILVIAGVILSVYGSEAANNLFWTFFSLSLVTLLISYVPLFLAYARLRKTNKTIRVFTAVKSDFMANVITYVPFILLVLAIVFTLFVDFTPESIKGNLPLIVGVVVSFIIEEILVSRIKEDKK